MNRYEMHLPSALAAAPPKHIEPIPDNNLAERLAKLAQWIGQEYESLQALAQKGKAGSPDYEHRIPIWKKGLAKYAELADAMGAKKWKQVTIRWPADAPIATIGGQWKRLPDGRIEATFTPEQLELCLRVVCAYEPEKSKNKEV